MDGLWDLSWPLAGIIIEGDLHRFHCISMADTMISVTEFQDISACWDVLEEWYVRAPTAHRHKVRRNHRIFRHVGML